MSLIDAVPRNWISAIKGKDLTNIKRGLKFDVTKIRLDRNTLSISSLNSKRVYTRIVFKKATSPVVASYLAGALEKLGANLEHVFLLALNLRIDMKIGEFYYKFICNRLATGEWLYRVGITTLMYALFAIVKKRQWSIFSSSVTQQRHFGKNTQNGGIMLQECLKILLRKILCWELAYPNYQ